MMVSPEALAPAEDAKNAENKIPENLGIDLDDNTPHDPAFGYKIGKIVDRASSLYPFLTQRLALDPPKTSQRPGGSLINPFEPAASASHTAAAHRSRTAEDHRFRVVPSSSLAAVPADREARQRARRERRATSHAAARIRRAERPAAVRRRRHTRRTTVGAARARRRSRRLHRLHHQVRARAQRHESVGGAVVPAGETGGSKPGRAGHADRHRPAAGSAAGQ